jgi:hypothetical protein
MVREFEEYASSKMEQLRASGIDAKILSAQINPNVYKLHISLDATEISASFTAWERGPGFLVESDIDVLPVLDGQFTSKTIQPKELQELIEAFDELKEFLTLQHHN